MNMSEPFRIGTRNSPLALKQADILTTALLEVHADLEVEIVPIKSNADWNKEDGEKPLVEEAGGKGLFAKEIETAILNGDVDCGVHSLKDMASFLPEGLVIDHVLPRANPCDAFISDKYKSVSELPEGATIGTCSPRRSALVLSKRPDLKVVPFRGNVGTRLEKIKSGQVDATFLAMAGLERLNIQNEMIHALSAKEFLPACGQGIVCMEIKQDNQRAKEILDAVHCRETGDCAVAEREVLKILDGSCHAPIGAYAQVEEDKLKLNAVVLSLDGQQIYEERFEGDIANAFEIGQTVGNALKEKVPVKVLAA